jgi:hypothetical protein
MEKPNILNSVSSNELPKTKTGIRGSTKSLLEVFLMAGQLLYAEVPEVERHCLGWNFWCVEPQNLESRVCS